MNADGSVLTFESNDRNWGPVPETSDNYDVFVRDRSTGTTERISQGTGAKLSYQPAISANGRYVAYQGYATPTGVSAMWVHDRLAKAARGGYPTGIQKSYLMQYPTVSNDGQYVSFYAHYSIGIPSTRYIAIVDYGAAPALVMSANTLALTEGGLARTYTIALSRAPSAPVTISIATDGQLNSSVTTMVFTSSNWNTPQTVSLQAADNGTSEAPRLSVVQHTISTTDPFFKVAAFSNVDVTVSDAVPPTIVPPGTPGTPLQSGDVTLNGTAAPGATVLLTLTEAASGAVQAVSVVADAQGKWLHTFLGLADGGYTVQAQADGIYGETVYFAVRAIQQD
jgi:hypothetical protein